MSSAQKEIVLPKCTRVEACRPCEFRASDARAFPSSPLRCYDVPRLLRPKMHTCGIDGEALLQDLAEFREHFGDESPSVARTWDTADGRERGFLRDVAP